MRLFNMKESIKEFPGDVFNLSKRTAATHGASHVKVNKGFAYLFLIASLACFHNPYAAAGEDIKLLAVKNRPVNIASFHNPVKTRNDSGIITGNNGSHGGRSNFIDLLLKELKSASPEKISSDQINGGNDRNPVLAELNTNIDKLCHILLAYFIPAVMFFISVPALIFYWARGSLKSERRMAELMKYNLSNGKNKQ